MSNNHLSHVTHLHATQPHVKDNSVSYIQKRQMLTVTLILMSTDTLGCREITLLCH